jgi:hypothetical protein
MVVHVEPLSVLTCQVMEGKGNPLAEALNVAVLPSQAANVGVRSVVMTGVLFTVILSIVGNWAVHPLASV